MKKFLFLPLFAALMLFSACSSDDDDNDVPEPVVAEASYKGDLALGETSLTTICTFVYNEASKSCDLTIAGLKFAAGMPAIDICLKNIPCKIDGEKMVFASTSPIVPLVTMAGMTMPYEDYKVESVEGYATTSEISLTASMQLGTLVFSGEYTDEKDVNAPVAGAYTGSMSVLATGADEPFVCEALNCEVQINNDNSALDLIIYGARFAQNMPVTVDIKLQAIPCTESDGGVQFAGNETIIPLVRMGEDYVPMEAYAFSSIEGVCAGGVLAFEASMTRGEFEFEGVASK